MNYLLQLNLRTLQSYILKNFQVQAFSEGGEPDARALPPTNTISPAGRAGAHYSETTKHFTQRLGSRLTLVSISSCSQENFNTQY